MIGAVWGANGYTTRAQADELHDHLADRSAMVVASGATLPFPPRTFDALVHTDVRC